ncbi:MAG TPA: hypothetical protein VMV52_07280 [Candidatus Nanopelagicaceae bacterium]|nr:hypothetical protein [Candidatus Nanopelagicaceae bacterium]
MFSNMADSDSGANHVQSSREIFWERIWAGLLVLYSVGAAYLVWRTLGRYGVNAAVFLVIDVVTSWPYGLATARIVVNVVKREWKAVRKWSWVAAITFIAPDVYVLASAHHAPRNIYLAIIAIIIFLILFAILSVVLQIRSWGKLAVGDAP